MADTRNRIAIIGGYNVTVFDRNRYDENGYDPDDRLLQAASVDHNKIFRASYGTQAHHQRLAMESREAWIAEDEAANHKESENKLFVDCGMLRVQPSSQLGALERETLATLEHNGLRDTQFIQSNGADRERAIGRGWDTKLLDFQIPDEPAGTTYEAVLDSTAGFMRCSMACSYYQKKAAAQGVGFHFGPEHGTVESLVTGASVIEKGKNRVTGLRTKDGTVHTADVVVVAAGSFSTQILPDLSYHLESSAGSVATFKISKADSRLWDKYSPERFPVITWKSRPRSINGKDTGSVYVLPRTPDGLVKIGYRGIKFTNFQPAPSQAPFSQCGRWSVPLGLEKCSLLPEQAIDAIDQFVAIFLPDFKDVPFHSTKLCWYTDSLDNAFVIDYVPTYAEQSVFVCTGGSGHGAKFLPVLGQHAADILEYRDQSTSFMRPFWRWRPEAPRRNGLEEGPGGPRDLANRSL